jgi:hypothetical protein
MLPFGDPERTRMVTGIKMIPPEWTLSDGEEVHEEDDD